MRKTLSAVVVVLVVAAIGGLAYFHFKKSTSTPTTTTTTTTLPQYPTAPLTGMPDPTGLSVKRPALTVKIENTPQALPQWGIDQADVVYEEIVNGGITRLAAIFNSHAPAKVGPVRSVRPTDTQVVWPLGGIFAYSGGAPYAVASISTAPVKLIDESSAGTAMFRDPNLYAPHNLFAIAPQLFAFGGTPVPPPQPPPPPHPLRDRSPAFRFRGPSGAPPATLPIPNIEAEDRRINGCEFHRSLPELLPGDVDLGHDVTVVGSDTLRQSGRHGHRCAGVTQERHRHVGELRERHRSEEHTSE